METKRLKCYIKQILQKRVSECKRVPLCYNRMPMYL